MNYVWSPKLRCISFRCTFETNMYSKYKLQMKNVLILGLLFFSCNRNMLTDFEVPKSILLQDKDTYLDSRKVYTEYIILYIILSVSQSDFWTHKYKSISISATSSLGLGSKPHASFLYCSTVIVLMPREKTGVEGLALRVGNTWSAGCPLRLSPTCSPEVRGKAVSRGLWVR